MQRLDSSFAACLPWDHEPDHKKVGVVGDGMLDEYYEGQVRRISPEAPVPVHLVQQVYRSPGGAGNTARNVHSSGGAVCFFTIIGKDEAGEELIRTLDESGVDTQWILQSESVHTVKKTRLITQSQQLARIDWERTNVYPKQAQEQLLEAIAGQDLRVLVISDYGKGLFSKNFLKKLFALCKSLNIKTVVDPKGRDFSKYQQADLITPNRSEAELALGVEPNEVDPVVMGRGLQEKYKVCNILMTLGPEGMVYIPKKSTDEILWQKASAREVYDVSGAGDTVVALFALGQACGLELPDCMHLANTAAGIVVEKWRTQAVERKELLSRYRPLGISSQDKSLSVYVAQQRAQGKSIAFTNGCFDILHAGHLTYLEQARSLADVLIVGMNSDSSIRKLKGTTRPVNPLEQRKTLLEGLRCVDRVVAFSEKTPLKLIEHINPDVLVKGADWAVEDIVGGSHVRSYGGEVKAIPLLPGISTSAIIRRVQTDDQKL